jgi:two-component system, sensor histidine kinase
MIKASIPEDEMSRLKDLYEYDVLDTAAEKIFDDLTQLASDICETPISLISLIDPKRQWFKSKHGIDVEETDRDIAFCSHAILQENIFEIQNTLLDKRFHDNPLVTSFPNIRFYAGTPLITPRGHTIGTLCVISNKPKKLTQRQQNALTILGKEVIAQLELRLYNKKLTLALKDQQAHNKKLAALKEKADTANHSKSQFLANMTHELRTPLHGILNLAELGLAEKSRTEKDDTLKSILSSANILSNIINDILDFSKIEAGKLDIENIDFNLHAVINDLIKPLKQQAYSKGIKFNVTIEQKIAANLKGDPIRVGQILNNLCSNAIKFTDHGHVSLKVSVQASSSNTQEILFEVVDSGVGISESAQANLFKEFHQADASTSRKFGGTGLGLSICSRLSDLMNGRINFTSKEGEGSVFSYQQTFAIASLFNVTKQPLEITDLQGCTVLVAEDNKINQMVVIKMLRAHNANVVLTENGKECIDYVNSNVVDLIFMDIQMPVIDGITATKEIRAQQVGNAIPIIAMTANTMKQDIKHYLDIGMDGYLTKPFDKVKLNSLLNVYNPNNCSLKNLAIKISDPDVCSDWKLKQICSELKALIPNANRVSLWLFNKKHSELNCLICLDEHNKLTSGAVLKGLDHPAYFNYILTHQVLNASDARNNEVTQQFNNCYFEPLGIYSLLDYIYLIDNKPLGVICCESVGTKVSWTDTDKQSLIKIADMTNLFLSQQIKPY